MTIIIIILVCWILYKSRKMAAFLDLFKILPETAPAAVTTTAPPEVFRDPEEPKPEPTPERLKLEAIAMNILYYKGIKTAPVRVKRLSDSELNNIIQVFKDTEL